MKTNLKTFPCELCDDPRCFCQRCNKPLSWKRDFEAELRSQIDENNKNIIGMDVESGIATGRNEVIEEILGKGEGS